MTDVLDIAIAAAKTPTSQSSVHREECDQCWYSQDDTEGVFCCATCYSGSCESHFRIHCAVKGHRVALWIHRTPFEKVAAKNNAADSLQNPPESKSETTTPTNSDNKIIFQPAIIEYKIETKWAIFPVSTSTASSVSDATSNPEPITWVENPNSVLDGIAEAILASPSDTADNFSSAFEIAPEPCPHTVTLEQIPNPPLLDKSLLSHCNDCELDNNLWLCLTTGHLGCGRKLDPRFYGNSGGNNHAIDYWNNTKYPVVVKMGTITPEGDASVYCYKCDENVQDPYLATHLAHFGINVVDQVKSEKSIMEQTLNLNSNIDFSSEWEAGKKAQKISSPGFTGLSNIGNSCYLSSTLQLLFHTPGFKQAFNNPNHAAECTLSSHSECPVCQFHKIYLGINESKWLPLPVPIKLDEEEEEGTNKVPEEPSEEPSEPTPRSHPPRTFKKLVAGTHPEFSGGKQQDSHEYMLHILDFVDKKFKNLSNNPAKQFSTIVEMRRQCTRCQNVSYSYSNMHSLVVNLDKNNNQKRPSSLLPPIPESLKNVPQEPVQEENQTPEDFKKAQQAHVRKLKKFNEEKVAFEETCHQISLDACFKLFHESHGIADYDCPVCAEKSILLETLSIHSFPEFFVVTLNRQTMDGWVPRKLAYHIIVPGDTVYDAAISSLSTDDSTSSFIPSTDILDVTYLCGKGGPQPGETLFPDSGSSSSSASSTASSEKTGPIPSEAIVSAIMGLGASLNAAKRAALAVDNASADHGAMWYFEHMGDADINDPIEEPKTNSGSGGLSAPKLNVEQEDKVSMLTAMTFPRNACIRALQENDWNSEVAANWLFGKMDEINTLEPISEEPEDDDVAPTPENVPLDTKPAKYQLIGFINHKGLSVSSGHYIATLSRSFVDPSWKGETQWVVFDDEKVFITKSPLMSQAYQLLFQRINS